jgi:hypothetical protein
VRFWFAISGDDDGLDLQTDFSKRCAHSHAQCGVVVCTVSSNTPEGETPSNAKRTRKLEVGEQYGTPAALYRNIVQPSESRVAGLGLEWAIIRSYISCSNVGAIHSKAVHSRPARTRPLIHAAYLKHLRRHGRHSNMKGYGGANLARL